MRLIVLFLVVFGIPAQAVTLSFDWFGGPVTYNILDGIEGYPDEPTRSHSASFVFEVSALDDSEFVYKVTYYDSFETIIENPQNALLINNLSLQQNGRYAEGYYKIKFYAGIVDIKLKISDAADHFTYFYSNSIAVDHNQGDIFKSSKGYWLAMLDSVVVGSSEPGFVLPPTDATPSTVPLPASLPPLLAAIAALFGLRRRRSATISVYVN